jgi:hypothetical protein
LNFDIFSFDISNFDKKRSADLTGLLRDQVAALLRHVDGGLHRLVVALLLAGLEPKDVQGPML